MAKLTMHPTEHEKAEWSRCAQAMYKCGNNHAGHWFSAAAALPANAVITLALFEALQSCYRAWLVFNEQPRRHDDECNAANDASPVEVCFCGGRQRAIKGKTHVSH